MISISHLLQALKDEERGFMMTMRIQSRSVNRRQVDRNGKYIGLLDSTQLLTTLHLLIHGTPPPLPLMPQAGKSIHSAIESNAALGGGFKRKQPAFSFQRDFVDYNLAAERFVDGIPPVISYRLLNELRAVGDMMLCTFTTFSKEHQASSDSDVSRSTKVPGSDHDFLLVRLEGDVLAVVDPVLSQPVASLADALLGYERIIVNDGISSIHPRQLFAVVEVRVLKGKLHS